MGGEIQNQCLQKKLKHVLTKIALTNIVCPCFKSKYSDEARHKKWAANANRKSDRTLLRSFLCIDCVFSIWLLQNMSIKTQNTWSMLHRKKKQHHNNGFSKNVTTLLSFSKGIYAHNADSPNVVTGDINTTKHCFSCWMWICELGTISKSPVPIPFHDNFLRKSTMSEKLQNGQCVRQSRPQWRIHRNLNKQTMWHSSN